MIGESRLNRKVCPELVEGAAKNEKGKSKRKRRFSHRGHREHGEKTQQKKVIRRCHRFTQIIVGFVGADRDPPDKTANTSTSNGNE
jgi:hypothetical protein